MQFQKQYNLQNKNVHANPPKGNHTKEAKNNIASSSQTKKDSTATDSAAKDYTTKDVVAKGIVEKGKQKEEP